MEFSSEPVQPDLCMHCCQPSRIARFPPDNPGSLPRSYPYPLGLLPNSDSYANNATGNPALAELERRARPVQGERPDGPRMLCRNVLDLDSNNAKSGSAPE